MSSCKGPIKQVQSPSTFQQFSFRRQQGQRAVAAAPDDPTAVPAVAVPDTSVVRLEISHISHPPPAEGILDTLAVPMNRWAPSAPTRAADRAGKRRKSGLSAAAEADRGRDGGGDRQCGAPDTIFLMPKVEGLPNPVLVMGTAGASGESKRHKSAPSSAFAACPPGSGDASCVRVLSSQVPK